MQNCTALRVLPAVMFAAIFAPPGHGIAAPLAAGLALFAITSTGKRPARLEGHLIWWISHVSWRAGHWLNPYFSTA